MTVIRPEGDPQSRGERDDSMDYIIIDDLTFDDPTTQPDEEFNARMEREQEEREDLARRMHEWSTRSSYVAHGQATLYGPLSMNVLELILGDLPWSTLDVPEPGASVVMNYHVQADAAEVEMQFQAYTDALTEEGTERDMDLLGTWEVGREERALDQYRQPSAAQFQAPVQGPYAEPDTMAEMGQYDLELCWRCAVRGDEVKVDKDDDLGLCGRCKRELKELSE